MIKNKSFSGKLMVGIFLLTMMVPTKAEHNYMAVTNCFHIIAPIHELSREMRLNDLWSFTQGRLGWLGGFIQANIENKDFDAAFKFELQRKKLAALAMKEDLRRAITRGDAAEYQRIIGRAVACDQVMGIRTDFVPRMGM